LIFALSSSCNVDSERGNSLEESTISSLSLVMLAVDLGGLGGGVLVDFLESVLVLASHELILLPGNSLLVGEEVGIGSSLSSGSGIEISTLSGGDEVLFNLIIESLKVGIEGSLLGLDGGTVGSLGSWESTGLVGSGGESSGSITLGTSSSGISSLGGGLGGSGGGGSGIGSSLGLGGTVESLGLGDVVSLGLVEGWDIVVIRETLVAPFTIAVVLEEDSVGASDKEGSDCEFHS